MVTKGLADPVADAASAQRRGFAHQILIEYLYQSLPLHVNLNGKTLFRVEHLRDSTEVLNNVCQTLEGYYFTGEVR